MHVRDVLVSKGTAVFTVDPDTTVDALLALLAEHNIGAVPVSRNGHTLQGLVSERDVVRGLLTEGPALLGRSVSAIMSTQLVVADPHDPIDVVMAQMTEHRVRHIPVVVSGRLVGLVSIGDLVKSRMGELESERAQLIGYISTAG